MNDATAGWEKVGGGAQADAWDFKNGKKSVSGQYVEKRTGLGPKNSTMYILEQPDGVLVGVWGSVAINTKFDNVQIGDEVKIDYLGMTKSKSGNDYHNFDLFRRPGGAVATGDDAGNSSVGEDDTDEIFDDLP